MSESGTSVTLIFYKISSDGWWREPALNLIAAAAQFSTYTHVELSIGEASGAGGQMANVVRIFNDAQGVELCERTGRNPQYTYLSLGCCKNAEQRMLSFARKQVGKPFSNYGMARSLLFPRQTNNESFYCAELVAAVLRAGGLLSSDSNPGGATPHSLFKLYSKKAAATANPYTLRNSGTKLSMNSIVGGHAQTHTTKHTTTHTAQQAHQFPLLGRSGGAPHSSDHRDHRDHHRRSDSPPRASFRLLSSTPQTSQGFKDLGLSLSSLRG